MAIRWDPARVAEALDKAEGLVNQVKEPLQQARAIIEEALNTPNLPGYVGSRLAGLSGEIDSIIGGVRFYDHQTYPGRLERDIAEIRSSLPLGQKVSLSAVKPPPLL